MIDPRFDDIRPYYDSEIPASMQRIATCPYFDKIASFVFPDEDTETVRKKIINISTVNEFQKKVMSPMNEQVIKRTMTDLTYGGIGNISKDKSYMYVSNHRDIVLDASLLQQILFYNGFETTQITLGANLMENPVVTDVFKSNKMFVIERGGSLKEFYFSSYHVSDYMRYMITQRHESVWIAQRNGRTKDGKDVTDRGVIKMFGMSSSENKVDALAELNILPVSVSYEWEPCDVLKAVELYHRRRGKYVKKHGEDVNSILTGILQPKGRVNFHFCDVVSYDDLMRYNDCSKNEFEHKVAELITNRICRNYMLFPNNYIAHDLQHNNQQFADRYTEEQKQTFVKHLDVLKEYTEYNQDELLEIFLGIYASPVDNL